MEKKYQVHQKILAEWLTAVNSGEFERAIQLDFYHYSHLVKVTEDVKFWDLWQKDTHAARTSLFERVAKAMPDHSLPNFEAASKFSIVNHNYSGLAHEVQLARNIQFLRRQGKHLDFDIIYLFDSVPDARQHAARLYDIPEFNLIFLSANSYKMAAEQLDLACRQKSYRTVIYPSIFNMAFWMSLFNGHPRQKFLQMKYYPFQAGRIAQWAGGRRRPGEHYSIHGFDFIQLETLDFAAECSTFSFESYSDLEKVTFGSISRPAKIADNNYNQFVKSLLTERPELTYLYAGQQEGISVIPEAVRRMSNALHIGWVNPVDAIKKFVIYLEPFPWGGGEMSFLALKAGVPYLSLATEDNIKFGLFDFLRLIASSGPDILQYSFCNTREELREKFLRLVDDSALRFELGDAWRKHVVSWVPDDIERWYNFFME